MTSLGAVVLAAGESTRIGSSKTLLRWRGKSFLENIVDALRAGGVDAIRVVTSPAGEKLIRRNLALAGVQLIVNPDPSRGQFSSLKCGLRDFEVSVVLVCLVDHPKISASVVTELMEACRMSDALAVIPRFEGKRGHPLALRQALVQSMLEAPDSASAKDILNRYRPQILEIDTADGGVVADIDTPDDYQRFLGERFPGNIREKSPKE